MLLNRSSQEAISPKSVQVYGVNVKNRFGITKLSVSPAWQDSGYQALGMLRDNLDLLAAPWEMGLGDAIVRSASRNIPAGGQ
ncbi:hypothetical protein ACFVVQ_06570 [Paenibacillus chitinolyticus]|uniref:hypothetical protein n=1 Tax=Paenibacillus chitinolyticus TaxID=79263 RepID=UPI0036D9F367